MNPTNTVGKTSSIFMGDINALDFTMVKLKLQDREEGLGWTIGECQEAEMAYKKFLSLKRAYPEKEIVPDKIVDQFWHQHILDTQKYAQDCQEIFGYFVHHFPYFGMKDEQDMQNLADAFAMTQQLYLLHFAENFEGDLTRCRTACKPVKCR